MMIVKPSPSLIPEPNNTHGTRARNDRLESNRFTQLLVAFGPSNVRPRDSLHQWVNDESGAMFGQIKQTSR